MAQTQAAVGSTALGNYGRTDSPLPLAAGGRTVRPFGMRRISGLTWCDGDLYALDTVSGRVARIDPATDDTSVVNDASANSFIGATSLAVTAEDLWFAAPDGVFTAARRRLPAPAGTSGAYPLWDTTDRVRRRSDRADVVALAVTDTHLFYVVDTRPQRDSRTPARPTETRATDTPDATPAERPHALEVIDRATGRRTLRVALHGVGPKNIAVSDDAIWIIDAVEQSVYCLDRQTAVERYSALTPMECPTAIAARPAAAPNGSTDGPWDDLLVAYYEDEPYIKDNPWIEPNWELRYRDRALIHPLHLHWDGVRRRAYSNGFLVEMIYLAECDPSRDDTHRDLEWRMALPINTPRQRVVSVEPIGRPFVPRTIDGDPVAAFPIERLDGRSKLVLGWRAVLEVWGLKYRYRPTDLVDDGPASPDDPAFTPFLVDNDGLAMDAPTIQRAAQESVGDATDTLTKLHRIRRYVYDRLSYEMGNADRPDAVLRRGTGSCGEYVGLLLALTRLNGIATRTAGRYKCLYQPWTRGVPLYPDFNHVWLDVHLPGLGWVPVESNPDDVTEGGPYPDRFFMGLPWRHMEVAKDTSFEDVVTDNGRGWASAGRLSSNHIEFRILDELRPGAVEDTAGARPTRILSDGHPR